MQGVVAVYKTWDVPRVNILEKEADFLNLLGLPKPAVPVPS